MAGTGLGNEIYKRGRARESPSGIFIWAQSFAYVAAAVLASASFLPSPSHPLGHALPVFLFTFPPLPSLCFSFISTAPFFFHRRRPRFARVYWIDCIFAGKYCEIGVKPKISRRIGLEMVVGKDSYLGYRSFESQVETRK